MKIFWVLFGILLLQATCDAQTTGAQTTAADEDVTTGSGDGEEPTTTPVDPCAGDPCGEHLPCVAANGDYTCTCLPGWSGKDCTTLVEGGGCEEEEAIIENSKVHIDVADCGTYDPTATKVNVTILFPTAVVGTTVLSNTTCDKTCDGSSGTRNVGVRTCEEGGTWSDPVYTNCASTSAEQTTETRLVNSQIETADPENIDSTVITDTIDVMEEVVAQDEVTKTEADSVVTLTNNLLQGKIKPNDVQTESMLAALDDLATSVVLDAVNTADYDEYLDVQSHTGFAVVGNTLTSRSFNEPYYFGPSGDWGFNLAASDVTVTQGTPPTGSYIMGQPVGTGGDGERLSFKIYSASNDIFPIIDGGLVANQVVLSANGTDINSFTFRFKITRDNITLVGTNSSFDVTDLTFSQLQCIVWDRANNKWNTDDACKANKVEGEYATCICSQPGEYTMREITYDTVISLDEGLSAGAIAGIVIGSVLGAALIGGGVYYFCFYKKKKAKRSAVTPIDNNEMEMHGHDNDVDDD